MLGHCAYSTPCPSRFLGTAGYVYRHAWHDNRRSPHHPMGKLENKPASYRRYRRRPDFRLVDISNSIRSVSAHRYRRLGEMATESPHADASRCRRGSRCRRYVNYIQSVRIIEERLRRRGNRMEWKPDKSLQTPVYRQIADYFETRIGNGEYPSGSSLPSERGLAALLDVNRSTIVAAYDQLNALGLVQRIKGFGTVVISNASDGRETKRIPNWEQYAKGGFLQLNDPITRQIHKIVGSDNPYINFALGELSSDLFPVALMKEAHSRLELSQYLGYEHIQGNPILRESIAKHLDAHRNISSASSSILVTSGAQQAIHLIIQCLLRSGDGVAIEDPSYSYSLPIFHSAGLRTFLLPVENDGIDPEQVVSLYKKHRIKMVFVNPIYHNPTGTTLAYDRRKRLLEISTNYGIAIVEDDPYSLTSFDQQPVGTLKSMDQDGSVLYLSSLSKIVSSGLRIGWITGPQSVIQRLTDAKQQMDFGHSNIPQWIAAQLLASPEFDDHLMRLRIGLSHKLALTANALRSEFGAKARFQAPQGGIHLWCELAGPFDEQRLFNLSIGNGVVFTPGSTLGTSKRHVRLTFSKVDDDQILPGIRKFAEAYRQARRESDNYE